VEKPRPGEAKSDLAVMGRYVLTPAIFPAIRDTKPGALGEIQLTDAIGKLLGSGEVWGLEFEGELLDVGTPAGWLATNLRLAKQYPEFSAVVAQSQGMAGA
jgi:UTP--glucose-1-phosphate uridylyltransferase